MGQKYVAIKRAMIGLNDEPVRDRLDIELTERCNNNCVHCCINLPVNDAAALAKELDTEEIIGLLSEAASLNYLKVRFTGGEPMLRPDFLELYLAARRLGLKVQIFTNATLITPKIADTLAHIVPGDLMELTLYGLTSKTYESVTRAPGSFDAAWQGIQLLLERSIPFVVKSVILPSNRHEIDSFISWTKSIPWMDGSQGFAYDFFARVRHDDERRNAIIRKLRVPWDEINTLLNRNMDDYAEKSREFAANFMSLPGDQLFSCTPSGCVDARGFFNPCLLMKCPTLNYDLRKGSLREAVTVFLPGMKRLKANNSKYLARCARCFLKSLCEQCPSQAWAETGALDEPCEYYCGEAHRQARFLGLLDAQENAWEVVDWQARLESFCGDKWGKNNGEPVSQISDNA